MIRKRTGLHREHLVLCNELSNHIFSTLYHLQFSQDTEMAQVLLLLKATS